MFYQNKYTVIIMIISFATSYSSEHKKVIRQKKSRFNYPNGQHKLYNNPDISITVKNNLLEAQKNYENKQYAKAALLAKGALTYAHIMNREHTIHEEDKNIFNYIIADCHLHYLNSPQHALDSLKKIHDRETIYGKIESNSIAQTLYKKAQEIELTNQKLFQKLHLEAHYYAINNVYQSYQQLYSDENNQKKDFLLQQCKKILDKQNKLRTIVFQLLNTKFISIKSFFNQIFSLESDSDFNEIISSFIESDKHFIIPILKKQIENNAYHYNDIYYFLGLLYYYNHNYKNAFSYLTNTKIYSSDINTQCKVLESFDKLHPKPSYTDALQGINILCLLFKPIIHNQKLSVRNQNAFFQNLSTIKFYTMNWAHILVDNKDYKKLFELIFLYVQQPQTYLTGIQIITLIHNKLAIDNKIDINSIETKFFQSIIEHFLKYKDSESLQCLSAIITHNIVQKESTYKRIDKKIIRKCIKYALTNNIYSQQDKEKLEAVCGRLYYQLSKNESQEELKNNYFNKSLRYNAHKTLLELASTILDKNNKNSIFTSTENMLNAMEIINKIKNLAKEHNSLSLQIKALNVLASIPFLLTLNSENIPIIEFPGDFIFNCMKKSYELGSTEHLYDLSYFYIFGIKDKNSGQWIMKPDFSKASEVLEYLLKINDAPLTYLELAKIYFIRGQEYYDKAFPYFNMYQKDLPFNNQKKNVLCYMSSIKLHTLNSKSILESASYIDQAISLDNMDFSLGNFIKEDLYLKISSYAQNLMKKNNIKQSTIELCALLGQIFHHQESFKNNFTLQIQASEFLQYAAKNKSIKAKMYLISSNDLNVHPWEKIKYIKDILNATANTNNSKLIYNKLNPLFYDLYPKKIQDRYEYIKYLKEKDNEKELEDYLESHYFGHIPLENNCYYTTTDNNLAQIFYEDTILKKYIDGFNQYNNKNSIPPHIINTIYIYSYALMNSNDPKIITLSASYFNKLQECPGYTTSPILQKLLSICFYKLAKCYKSNNNFLANQYLIKSAHLNNEDAIIYSAQEWLQNDYFLKKNINVNQIIQWLQTIKNESNKTIVEDLIEQYCQKNKLPNKKKNKSHTIIIKRIDEGQWNAHIQAQTILQSLIQKAQSHDYLIETHKCPELFDSLFQSILEIHDNEERTNKLSYLALYHNHPHAAILVASQLYKENIEKTKFYLELAFKNGIITSSSNYKMYVFKDLTFLKILSNFISTISKSPNIFFLSYIKKRLQYYKINIDYLTQYIFDLKNYDLNQYKEWNS